MVRPGMNRREAAALIEEAVGGHGGAWADLGAGSGTFTRALVDLLGHGVTVYAMDRDRSAVAALGELARASAAHIVPVEGDFIADEDLPRLPHVLDGLLLANALHFVRDAGIVLARLVRRLRAGGRVVLVEYDRRGASRWVPYPTPVATLPALAHDAGLTPFTVTATRPSRYQGTMYAAFALRE
jgi:SAM-dependent methyltransferase